MIKSLKDILQVIINFAQNVVSALGKFVRSSYLSLTFLAIILFALQGIEQVNTLLVDMIEENSWSLYFAFYIIAAFSSVLAHYPRYIYYTKNINESRDDHYWYVNKIGFYPVFTFSKIRKSDKSSDKPIKKTITINKTLKPSFSGIHLVSSYLLFGIITFMKLFIQS